MTCVSKFKQKRATRSAELGGTTKIAEVVSWACATGGFFLGRTDDKIRAFTKYTSESERKSLVPKIISMFGIKESKS